MKLALALLCILCFSLGVNPGAWGQSPPPAVPQESGPPTQAAPQPAQPPSLAQPCSTSKDTCELSEPTPQNPSGAQVTEEKAPPAKAGSKAASHKKHKRHHHKSKPNPQPPAQTATGPRKVVVRDGGTSDPTTTLTPGAATPRGTHSRQDTEDLLSSTDTNLKQASARSLDANQQASADQIRIFITQANAAIKAGDLDRAHNLATKAHLLSDDLVKH